LSSALIVQLLTLVPSISILHGEIIQYISPEIGLLHRGTEKLIECNYYLSSLPYFDRFDYVSTITQELLYVISLERLIGCFGYIYSSTWRTLFCEFYRILNHSLAITTHAIDIGLFTLMLWNFEEREKLIYFCEVLSGTRFHAVFLIVGRLRYDISLRWISIFSCWLMHFVRKLKEIHNILSVNRLWRTRLYEIGLVRKNFCLFFGFSGLLSRSVKIWIDGRFSGYEFYSSLDYSIFITSNGDCLDRYLIRYNEMIESCRIMYSVLYLVLSLALFWIVLFYSFGRKRTNHRNNSRVQGKDGNTRTRLCSSRLFIMELLIAEFLIQVPFILSIISEIKFSIESSKGIYSIFIFSTPIISSSIVSNDYIVLNQLNKFCKYINIGDLIAILGSIDFVSGSVDLIWSRFNFSSAIHRVLFRDDHREIKRSAFREHTLKI